ncbi:hypothetical protein [Desulfatirhabdium butyrativorans]|uniref:hypothetical protein n=1 Tax=Desulfatirhabdium butyrativorans TaxID=340467 RepID=UPI000486E046|nr:hypothetical protein [Desulfatirhabdium butyrativorans]
MTTILSGDDIDWSTSYRKILEQIPSKKIFVILDDIYLASRIDEVRLTEMVSFVYQKDAKYMRYWANPLPDVPTENPWIGVCAKGAPYRSTVCGIWDRDYLLRLLLDGESPWNFEIMGSYRTSYSDGFYSLTKPLCSYKNMVEKGKWIPASVEWATANRVPLSVGARPMLTGGIHIKSLLQMIIFNMIIQIPWRTRVSLMNQFRKLFISY